MPSDLTAAAAGTWKLGDLTVNRIGFGAARGVSEQQIRLAWTLHQSPNVLAIPGAGDPAHLEENIAAGAIKLPTDELATLADRRA